LFVDESSFAGGPSFAFVSLDLDLLEPQVTKIALGNEQPTK